jgi:hypothetical protein
MSLPRTGNIKYVPLAIILEELRTEKATGTLTLKNDQVEKSVFLKDGQVIFSKSTDMKDRLGEILVKVGKLTREDLDKALVLNRKHLGLKKLGAILVENGMVTPKDLFNALKTQVNDIIVSLFQWSQAEYSFTEQLPADVIPLQINIQGLISDIIKRFKKQS